jgi:hypothetical protein
MYRIEVRARGGVKIKEKGWNGREDIRNYRFFQSQGGTSQTQLGMNQRVHLPFSAFE